MRSLTFFLVGSACAGLPAISFAQGNQDWELQKYPDIAYRIRAFELFRFLAADYQHEKGLKSSSEEFQIVNRAVTLISLELAEAGVFIALDKPLRNERFARLSPAGKVFYEYYRQALAKNPVFRDLFKPLPANTRELYVSYWNYRHQSPPDDERSAYESAGKVFDELIGPQPSRFPWAWVTVALMVPLMTAGLLILYRRRGKKPAATPIKNVEQNTNAAAKKMPV